MKKRCAHTALLTACLAGRAEKLDRPARVDLSQEAWEDLIREAAGEFVLPVLNRRLGEIGLKPPGEVAEFLAAVEELNGERNAQILEEAWAIARLLNGIGIEPVALKGVAFLLEGVYPGPGCRYLCDLDLLVPQARLAEAAEILERDGYRQDGRDAMARFRHHYPQLQRPRAADGSGSAPVELHHSLGHGPSKRILSGEAVWRGSTVRERDGVRLRVPSPEHLATHLILHSQLHHTYSERIWPPPRAIYDLVMLDRHFGEGLDWKEIRGRFWTDGQETTLLLHLLQVERTLGMARPFAFELRLLGRLRWARRQALNRRPALRLVDPVYLVSSTLSRRMQFLTSIAAAPGGWKYAARMLSQPGFYRRLLAEIALR